MLTKSVASHRPIGANSPATRTMIVTLSGAATLNQTVTTASLILSGIFFSISISRPRAVLSC